MKVSKVVLIVVALHVLVIGGIFVFEGCSRSRVKSPDIAGNESQPGIAPDQAATPGTLAPTDPLAVGSTTTPTPIPAGMTPAVPTAPVAVATAVPTLAIPAPAAATYTVAKNDSLWKIARKEGITLDGLMSANNLTKDSTLQIGQKLTIPAKIAAPTAVATASAPASPAAAPAGGHDYVVKSGDSLWKIASQNGVSVASIKQANNLSSDKLKIGQKLSLPARSSGAASTAVASAAPAVRAAVSPVSYQTWDEPGTSLIENGQTIYMVNYNESLGVIARKYGVKQEELMKVNRISDPRNISPGQRLIIPNAGATSPAAGAAAAPATTTSATPAGEPGLAAPVIATTTSVH